MTDSPVSPDLLRTIAEGMADAVPFATHAGVELLQIDDGSAVATLPALAHTLNHVGTVHAGALFTLAETASGGAMAATFGPMLFDIRPLVSGASIEYRRPATGTLTATASIGGDPVTLRRTLLDEGRVSTSIDVAITDSSEREVASFAATWVIKHRPSAP